MSHGTHRSSRRLQLVLLAAGTATLLAAVAETKAQPRTTTLRKIEILGLQRVSSDQAIAATGLKVGDQIDAAMIDAAADKLMRSGWFQSVDYRVRTAESDSTVIFEIVEKSPRVSTAKGEVLGQFVWSGNTALSNQELDAAFGLRPGDSADVTSLNNGLAGVKKAYGHRGFINAEITRAGQHDDLTRRVNYQFTIREGSQFRMGVLTVIGLTPSAANQLKSQWTLAPNAIFDDSYLEQFRNTVIRPFVASRTQRTGVRSKYDFYTKPDTQKQTVDVVITFK